MFQPHNQNATATAIVKGLAIAKHNSNWEFTFLRNCGHYPKFIIKEVDRATGKLISIIKTREIEEGDAISITVSNSTGTTAWKHDTGGDFDRDATNNDPQDLRWMLDINQLHGKKVRRKIGAIVTNSLTIADSYLYTAVQTKDSYQKRWIDAAGTSSKFEHLGITGQIFGADVVGSAVKFDLQGNNPYSETLPHSTTSRYVIIFDNTCAGELQPQGSETDFHNYYKLIDDSEGKVDIQIESPDVIGFQADPPPDDGDPPPDDPPKIPACQGLIEGGE